MLAANHWTKPGVPNGRVSEMTEGAEGFCNPIGRKTVSTKQATQSSQGLSHQPRSTHGSSYICSRELPCQATMEGKVLGLMKATRCPSAGESKAGR